MTWRCGRAGAALPTAPPALVFWRLREGGGVGKLDVLLLLLILPLPGVTSDVAIVVAVETFGASLTVSFGQCTLGA